MQGICHSIVSLMTMAVKRMLHRLTGTLKDEQFAESAMSSFLATRPLQPASSEVAVVPTSNLHLIAQPTFSVFLTARENLPGRTCAVDVVAYL
jgi:hypothetical protein